MNKTTIGIIVALVVVAGGVYLISRPPTTMTTTGTSTNATPYTDQTKTTATKQNISSQGRVVFAVTDAAADMTLISEISMKVSKVEVYNKVNGWVTVSTTPRTYSLLALNAKKESSLLADIRTKAGTYDQVRVTVDGVSVKTSSGTIKTAKLPSNKIAINTVLVVNANQTASVNLDFIANESLYTTGLGDYIFAPVVRTQTESNAILNINGNGMVAMSSGHVDDTNTFGMDIDGSVKLNFKVDERQKLQIDSSGNIKVETP